jgi:branched-chain amino acid transport system substrate-binding protein
MKTGKWSAGLLILIGAGVVTSSENSGAEVAKTLDVGIVLRLNDSYNVSVQEMAAGIETARTLFEKVHPGVHIKLHRYAHTEDLASVATAADQVASEKVAAVIGGELSEESFVLRDKLGAAKIVFITPTSSNPAVTEGRPFAFRACFSDRLVAARLASFTISHLKPKAVGLIHNVSSPYTDFLGQEVVANFRLAGKVGIGSVPIYEEKVIRDTMDFSPQIRRFMENGVSHVIMPTHQNDLLRFAAQASSLGFFPVYIGSDGWGSNVNILERLVKLPVSGAKFVGYRNSYWKEDASTSMALQFQTEFKRTQHKDPSAWSAISFDAAWILFTAMEQTANPRSGEEIRVKLNAIRDLALVTSKKFAFGADNSPRKDLYIYRIDKVGVHYEATLK